MNKQLALKIAITWAIKNVSTFTLFAGVIWYLIQPHVLSFIVDAVAEQKYVTQQTLESVETKVNKIEMNVKELDKSLDIINNQNVSQQLKVNEIERRLNEMNTNQRELNSDIKQILREFRNMSDSIRP